MMCTHLNACPRLKNKFICDFWHDPPVGGSASIAKPLMPILIVNPQDGNNLFLVARLSKKSSNIRVVFRQPL